MGDNILGFPALFGPNRTRGLLHGRKRVIFSGDR